MLIVLGGGSLSSPTCRLEHTIEAINPTDIPMTKAVPMAIPMISPSESLALWTIGEEVPRVGELVVSAVGIIVGAALGAIGAGVLGRSAR